MFCNQMFEFQKPYKYLTKMVRIKGIIWMEGTNKPKKEMDVTKSKRKEDFLSYPRRLAWGNPTFWNFSTWRQYLEENKNVKGKK